MKKVICIMIVAMLAMTVSVSFGETSKSFGTIHELLEHYNAYSNILTLKKDTLMKMYSIFGEDATVEYVRTELIGLKSNEEGMFAQLIKQDDYSRFAVLIYDISEKDIANVDKNIIRVIIIELV